MMPYRDPSGDGLLCVRCGGTTPLNPDAAARPPEGPFVCATCLVQRQMDSARTQQSSPAFWDPSQSRAIRDKQALVILLMFSFFGLAAKFFGGLPSRKTASGRSAGDAASESADARPESVAADEERRGRRPRGHLDPQLRGLADPEHDAMMAAKERGDAAGRGEQQQAFSSYMLGLEGGGTALPKGLPLAWKLGGSSVSGPFDRAVWGTDEALTDVRVLVEKERLRLGGKGLKAGEAVSCAGVVEPGQGDAALFVAGCQDATGSVSYRVHRVLLSGLARVLAGGTPGLLMGIPIALRGTYKTDPEDCKHAKGELMVSASAIAEKGGPSVVAITATSSRLGTVLSGVNPADGRLCSAVVDEVAGVVRLRTTCNGRARYLLCKR